MYKNILFISTDKHLGEVLRTVLIRKSMKVVLASTLEEVKRFVDREYDIILFETLFGINIQEMMTFFASYSHLKNAERWMMVPKNTKSIEAKLLKENWDLAEVLIKPISPLELMRHFKKKVNTKKPISLNSLRLLSQIWVTKSSMVVHGRSLRVIFVDGSLVSHSSVSILKTLLEEDFLRPSNISTPTNQNNFAEVGKFLLESATEKPQEDWSKEYKACSVIWGEIDVLPEILSSEVLVKLQKDSVFSEYKPDEQKILYGLWKMGIIQLKEKVEVLRKSKKVLLSFMDVKQILKKELGQFKGASALDVLGLTKNAGLFDIINSSRRMEARYQKLATDYPHSREIGEMVGSLLELVQTSARRLSDGGYANEESLPEYERLYQYGMRQIKNQNWVMAEKALMKAAQMRIEDSRILAAKGWAEFNNPERDKEKREKDGMESMLLAIHLEKEEVSTLVFVTKAYLSLDDLENALGPIKLASTLTPDPEVQGLRAEVEQRIQQSKV
jgi:hypothetical protein